MDKEIIIAMENWLSERIEPLAEKLARQMEPLAVSMATLADDTREALKQTQDESMRQSREWADKLQVLVKEWELKQQAMTKELESVTRALTQQAQAATKASRGFTWRRWLKVMAVALIVSIVSPSAYNLWQNHYSKKAETLAEAQKNWQWILERYNELKPTDKKTVNELLGLK